MRNNCFPSVFPLFGCYRENRPPLITLTQQLSFLLLWIIGPMMALWPHRPCWRVSPGSSSRSQSVSTLHRYLTCFTCNDLLYLNKIKLSKKKHTNIWQSTSSWSESRDEEWSFILWDINVSGTYLKDLLTVKNIVLSFFWLYHEDWWQRNSKQT